MMPSRVRSHQNVRNGDLAVECWCRHEVIFVPPSVIRAGRTGTCGRDNCKQPVEATNAR